MKMYITQEARSLLEENGFHPWFEKWDQTAEFEARTKAKVNTLTLDEVREISEGLIDKTAHRVLSELGIKGYPMQSGRIYRKQIVQILGLQRYTEAVDKGWLKVRKPQTPRSTPPGRSGNSF